MKGLVLSGGAGTRLRPITHTSAKQLVPVANKPVLFYGLEAMREAGVEEVGIVVGETRAEIEAAVGDGGRFGLRVTYIPQEAPLGLAHAVLISEGFLGADPFVMYLGDNLLKEGILPFVKAFDESRPDALILLQKVNDPKAYGIAELEGGRVMRLVEKPAEPRSDLALVGVYLFTASVFTSIRSISYSARGELEITEAIQNMIDRGLRVEPHMVSGWWKDTGKLEDMLDANRLVLSTLATSVEGDLVDTTIEGPVQIGCGSRLEKCCVRGPVVIGRDCHLTHAYVGPYTAISNGVVVEDAEIEHSIILDNSQIRRLGGRMTDSLVGRDCVIARGDDRPVAYRFMVGDASQIGIL